MNSIGRTAFETLIITSLTGILVVIAISTFLGSVRLAKEVALRSELGNVRTAVALYQMLARHNPENLRKMVREGYVIGFQENAVIRRRYLESASTDDEGNPLDPFGNPFVYDKKTGIVRSSTAGYERW